MRSKGLQDRIGESMCGYGKSAEGMFASIYRRQGQRGIRDESIQGATGAGASAYIATLVRAGDQNQITRPTRAR